MSGFLTILRRELFGFAVTPAAYVTGVLFLAVHGLVFWSLVAMQSGGPSDAPLLTLLLGSPLVWILQLVVPPVLTMRSFAEERRSGAMEILLTAPVSDTAAVLAKYLAALAVYAGLWAMTLVSLFALARLNAEHAAIDPGAVLGGYGFLLVVGMLYLAVGLYMSACTSHQMVAAIGGFSALALLFLAGFADLVVSAPALRGAVALISSHEHMIDFSRGILDTRPLVFHLGATAFVLFAAVKRLEARQWKG